MKDPYLLLEGNVVEMGYLLGWASADVKPLTPPSALQGLDELKKLTSEELMRGEISLDCERLLPAPRRGNLLWGACTGLGARRCWPLTPSRALGENPDNASSPERTQ